MQDWYAAFVRALGDELLFEVLLAGNYLDLPPLLELCAATVGLRMMSKFFSLSARTPPVLSVCVCCFCVCPVARPRTAPDQALVWDTASLSGSSVAKLRNHLLSFRCE